MAVSLPYLVSYKNLPVLFDKINSAKIPEKFTHNFLLTTIGLKGTNDRALIPLLRTAASTCGVMCTYARCSFVLNVRYSVWKVMRGIIQKEKGGWLAA